MNHFVRCCPLVSLSLVFILGCSRSERPPIPPTASEAITVYAPWSFEKRLRRIVEMFEAQHPACRAQLVTGTPGKLIARVQSGERPDVYIAMGPKEVEVLQQLDLVVPGTERKLLKQTMVLATRDGFTGKITKLQDLARPDVQAVGIGRPALTAGDLSRRALEKAGVLEQVMAKSQKSPFHSLVFGEVDAGIIYEECCYEEDLFKGERVPRRGINVVCHLPADLCEPFPMPVVALRSGGQREAARPFIDVLCGKQARAILLREGPGACPVCEQR